MSTLLNVEQVAIRLGISANTVRRLSAQKLIPSSVRVGRRLVRWDAAEIERYCEGLAAAEIDLGVEIEGKELA